MMQIKAILLYNHTGEIRRINFKLNQVNIITGKSKTGKSSIIPIISYCMGRSRFQVAAGVIQDSVAWYAVLYQLNDLEVFIAKQPPELGQARNNQAYFEIAQQIDIPEMQALFANSNDDAVVDELSRRLGISPNLNIPAEGETRESLSATIRHTEYYLFQPQDVIASRSILFYRQSEPQIPQAIKDTMNYFLGVVQEDRLSLIYQINNKRRELRSAKRDLEETKSLIAERVNRGISLVIEAQQVGLLSQEHQPQSFGEALELLRTLRGWQPTINPIVVEDRQFSLQDQIVELRREFQSTHEKIHAAEFYIQSADGYSREASEQTSRLQSIHLFEDSALDTCPLCGTQLLKVSASVESIYRSLLNLQSDLEVVSGERPELEEYINDLRSQLEEVRRQINQKELDLQAAISEQEAATQIRDSNARIARVVGRISYFLDTTPSLDDESAELRIKVERLQREFDLLEEQLDSENLETRRMSILNIIGNKMTELSQQLDIEEGPYRFDWRNLTVVADRPVVPIVMNQNMGSAANHLGSHLIALLALHWYFINQDRPVPNFLVLDQPTQVYFPPEIFENVVGLEDAKDEDRQAVNKIFDLLFNFAEAYGLQIVVLDHANLDSIEFQNAIVDNVWRGDYALIPLDWEQDT
ncbi:MAG: DUF3732 domain-containing protein [Anaerolineae bacterium]|nr:DUF3732 domain-containing protein [Anaerolineae bacterium]